ncbi:MAG: primosomal protein N' [Acidobacteriia bacterium]|nr:primosomal protein N' [Terriglobia bacterium]
MAEYCDVALPVPLEANFTYRLNGAMPVIGGRVIVPFREQRLPGIVVALHDTPPRMAAKNVLTVLDASPVLDPELMKLGQWIADYYVAPLGEVFRTMLPLGAEFRRARGYRLTDRGMEALHQSATLGSSLRSPKSAEDQAQEIAVLNHLLDRDIVREESLRSATRATRETLNSLVRKKWIERVDLSAVRDATRTIRIAVLNESVEPRCAEAAKGRALNANQNALLDALKKSGGRIAIEQLNRLPIPRTTLATLIKRGLVMVENQPAEFRISSLKTRGLDFIFSQKQKTALEQINTAVAARKFSVTLLHGITGSGKTAVYLAAMQEVLRSGRSAIMLVPEIGLTPAAAAHLHQVFGEEVAILHSGLSDAERAEQWHRIRRSEARMVVGTRSAVFAPVSDLALIVVDEEHDTSYKQEETPRYHARDVAIMRAKMKTAGAAVVLGSATPSLESYHNARTGKYSLVELPDRVERRPLPEVEILDMREEFRATGMTNEQLISRKLAADIGERLARNEQIMLLLNRRGYSAFVLCRTCGDTVQCKNCAISMTHHKRRRVLECHYCGYTRPVPQTCPKCASEYVQFLGSGSEKLEEQLHGMFPQARIARLDRDTVHGRDDFERVLSALHAGELDMVVGTQMIAKGHDIHGVTLVGVVGADLALMFPDFRSAERTFQLLAQVAGRAGRGSTPGTVILQTYFPEHYAVQYAAQHDFRSFYEKELRYRNWMRYPPFSALANVLVRSNRLDDALKWAGTLGNWLEKTPHEGIRALGPAAAPLSRLKTEYRYHFVLKSSSRAKLNGLLRAMLAHAVAQKIPRTNVVVDVDALSLL